EITQDMINRFAELTGDHQWIHVDVERAKRESPFGGTVAHGFLTLSLLPRLHGSASWKLTGYGNAPNYGANKLRFVTPVRAGATPVTQVPLTSGELSEYGSGRDAPRPTARSLPEGEGIAHMTLTELLKLDIDPSDPANRDPEFIRTIALPVLNAIRSYYFRWEAEGAEQVPSDGPFITVANHNGGPVLADAWVMLSYWWTVRGVENAGYALVHDSALSIP